MRGEAGRRWMMSAFSFGSSCRRVLFFFIFFSLSGAECLCRDGVGVGDVDVDVEGKRR
jgi:hypothetical protein